MALLRPGPGLVNGSDGAVEHAVWVVASLEVLEPTGVGAIGEAETLVLVGAEQIGVAAGQGVGGQSLGKLGLHCRWAPPSSSGVGSQAARISTSRWSWRKAKAV